ncbi:MGMT family protein [Candidatus Borreliella tachyglossi]|uniref:MGMT family protein n=1 Tax=Candidatus Borreliella tachyglossi TaxID=1964448 RepID=UPI00131F07D2|nr:MGMT family protein [Candidatus Borreliella tachyglossi]
MKVFKSPFEGDYYGLTYAELAVNAGFNARYSRYMGYCMTLKVYPLMIPYRRVISKDSKIEVFNCPGGISLKRFYSILKKIDHSYILSR